MVKKTKARRSKTVAIFSNLMIKRVEKQEHGAGNFWVCHLFLSDPSVSNIEIVVHSNYFM